MASHSNLIGLGVGCKSKGRGLQEQCIVFHCLDKTLIPFGEEEFPEYIEGYPIELRNDYIMLGQTRSNFQPLKSYMFAQKVSGSVMLYVKSNSPSKLSKCGFLTPEQVASAFAELHAEEALFTTTPFPEATHETVCPSFIKKFSEIPKSDPERIRMDTASVIIAKSKGIFFSGEGVI